MAETPRLSSPRQGKSILKSLRWIAALIVAIGAIIAATLKAIDTVKKAGDASASRVANQQAIIGEIRAFATEKIPDGWLECDGTSLEIDKYSDLFRAIGTAWGSPDQNHFNAPDLRGQFLRGWNHDREKPVNEGETYFGDPDIDSRIAPRHGGNTKDHIGSVQPDELREHSHQAVANKMGEQSARPEWEHNDGMRDIGAAGGTQTGKANTSKFGGRETRPTNSYVMFCIYAGPQSLHLSK
jgi:microcystin-dependent protein